MKIYYNQELKKLSQGLRKNGTLGEVLLWKELKGKKIGYPFSRQKPILSYIVDFYCAPLNLAIEIDGITHDAKIEKDVRRQQLLEKLGVTVLRFTEGEVRNNLDSVLREIELWIKKRTTLPTEDGGTPFSKGDTTPDQP
ncbi:MAG: hypothetical protein UY50_C0023G0027 [Parcubacteria group bacterium GW2011_GWA2_49_9]|nr:MAG: hypothetical protein UY50_C0023G0027 [Parcubacteria group bacterium GW2011_GWA2_49_9]